MEMQLINLVDLFFIEKDEDNSTKSLDIENQAIFIDLKKHYVDISIMAFLKIGTDQIHKVSTTIWSIFNEDGNQLDFPVNKLREIELFISKSLIK